jgi:SPP1 gp7 family putative phage head morphogenesis protein
MLVETAKTLTEKVVKSYSDIAIDYTTPDTEMLARLTRDTWQFSAAKNYQELRDLTLLLKDENGKLREWNDFHDAAAQTGLKYNETWMYTEYNQAIAASQNAARWTEFESEKDIIPNLQYQTVGDNVVRPEHQLLDGIIKPIDDRFWDTHYPPNGWGCRCETIQSLDDEVTSDEKLPDIPIAPMFRTNLAKTGLIYPKNHPYYSGVPRPEIRKAILYLPPENTYQSVVIGNHEIDIHPLHGTQELPRNIETCAVLLKHDPNAKLKLLPIVEEKDIFIKNKFYPNDYVEKFKLKNADVLSYDNVVEFEEPVFGSKNSIKNAIRGGKEQADFVIFRIDNNSDWDDVERQVWGQLNHYKGQKFDLWIMNDNELRKYRPKSK